MSGRGRQRRNRPPQPPQEPAPSVSCSSFLTHIARNGRSPPHRRTIFAKTAKGVPDATTLLQRWSSGDRRALDDLMAIVNDELRRLAQSALMRENPRHTLQATALVNELYLRLVDQRQVGVSGKRQFFGVAAVVMRRILVDHAKARKAGKRGGDLVRADLPDLPARAAPAEDLLAIDEALTALQALDDRKARVVELKFFAGLHNEEIAGLLDISLATVERDWAMAKSWLYDRMAK